MTDSQLSPKLCPRSAVCQLEWALRITAVIHSFVCRGVRASYSCLQAHRHVLDRWMAIFLRVSNLSLGVV